MADRAVAGSLIDQAASAVESGVDGLFKQIEKTRKALDEEEGIDIKLSSHLSYLTTGAAGALDKLRALAKHERNAAKALSPDERDAAIVSMVEDMPVDRRRKLIGRLVELDGAGELLG